MTAEQHGEETRYRALFEGSQASLSDMASRQAQALARVGRLRNAVVTVLRKNFMELSAQAEANLGKRLSETDDEILIAYLDAFTGAATRNDQRATIQAIGEALLALGIPIRGEEPLLWVEQIHQHRQALREKGMVTRPASPMPEQTAPVRRPLLQREEPPAERVGAGTWREPQPEHPEHDPLPAEDYWQWETAPVLQDLFSDALSQESGERDISTVREQEEPASDAEEVAQLGALFTDLDRIAIEPERWDGELGNPGPQEETWSPSPVKARPGRAERERVDEDGRNLEEKKKGKGRDRGTSRQEGSPKEKPGKGQPARNPAPAAKPAGKTVEDAPDAVLPATQRKAATDENLPAGAAPAGGRNSGLDDATWWGSDTTPITPQPAQPEREEVRAIEETLTVAAAASQVHQEPEPMFEEVAPPRPAAANPGAATEQSTAREEPRTPEDAVVEEGANGQDAQPGVNQPLRPGLFPAAGTTGKRKKGRTVRAQVQRPEEIALPLVENTETLEINDGMRNALLAAASIPRPVFTRDLVGVVGDLALVDAWEAECRANVSTSPVRFVVPKTRHRMRGRLVAVERSEVDPTDWWYQAVAKYRGGRLYELGVLLHRVGDEIVSFSLQEQTALFRLSTPRGLIGVVVCLDGRIEGALRLELQESLERLMTERLTLVAVLATSAEPGSLEALVEGVETLAAENQWRPPAPVVAARSWEYADDRGSSAVMILGQ